METEKISSRRAVAIFSGIFSGLFIGIAFVVYLARPASPWFVYFLLLGIWAALAWVLSFLGEKRRLFAGIAAVILVVELCDLVAALGLRIGLNRSHMPLDKDPRPFTYHPNLVGIPSPGIRRSYNGLSITHDSSGHRTVRSAPRNASKTVALFGGSTTYDVLVSDGDTWAELLQQRLGTAVNVVNLGVPGYTTAEHLMQTAFDLSDLKPACAVYYVGWNDLAMQHIATLRSDYSDYHFLRQFENLSLRSQFQFNPASYSALLYMAKGVANAFILPGPPQPKVTGAISGDVDSKALSYWTQNLEAISVLNHARGIRTVFIPQILNASRFTSPRPYGWLPLVPDSAVPRLMKVYNDRLEEISKRNGDLFASGPQEVGWTDSDFMDYGHFSPSGTRKFAQQIEPAIRTCLVQ